MIERAASDPRLILRDLEQRARRRFGQHFLDDVDTVRRIVRASRVAKGERVVEIGPGLGILTDALLEAEVELLAVELDRDLAAFIRTSRPSVRLVEADAARVHWAELCEGGGWKVVANLPFNVGTTVLMQILRLPAVFSSMTVMLQREVAQRLAAEPGSKSYGALSVEAQARGTPLFLFDVPPERFYPRPKVTSAVIRFDLFPAPRVGDVTPTEFDRVVRAAFSQRRKTLLNAVSASYGRDETAAALASAGIDPRHRAEVLDLAQFRRLAQALHNR